MIGRGALLAALLAIAVVPVVGPAYYTTLMLPFFGYGVALLGMNLLFGYTGLLSFGHALFVALGAYTVAALTSVFAVLPLEVALMAAVGLGAVVALSTGVLCVRYVRIYFGVLTLALGMLFYSFLVKFYHITGGDEGMRVLRPILFGQAFPTLDKVAFLTGPYYYYALGLLTLAALVMWRIVGSPFGLRLRAIRENVDKAAFLGVDVRRARLAAFIIAGTYGAVGGVLLAVPTGLADPLLAYWTHSGNLVFMLLVGGFAHFFGPVVGAFVFIFLQDQVMSLTQYWRFVFGVVLAVVVMFFPRGLMGLVSSEGGFAPHPDRRGPRRPPPSPPPETRLRGQSPRSERATPAQVSATAATGLPQAGATPVVLEAVGVGKRYGDVVALDEVSLTVREGEFVSIIGPNGAGKTTLVNVLSGLSPPSGGRIVFKGDDVTGAGPVRLSRLGMARTFQLVSVFPGLSVADTLAVAVVSRLGRGHRALAALSSDAEVQADVERVAALFGLGDRLGRLARTLSQGDKKLLDVASAFALHPEVILLDEPTSGVSTREKHTIMEVLVDAAARLGITAIIQVEHDMDIVFGYSHRIVALHAGRVLADAPPDVIRADDAVVATVIGRRA